MKTRTMSYILAIAIMFLLTITFMTMAQAADKILETTVDSAVTALDKNGAEYVRIIITEPRTLNGISYQKSLPVMAFGATVADAKSYQAGDELKAIVTPRNYQGSESYTVVSFVK